MFFLGTGASLYRYYFFFSFDIKEKHVFDNFNGLSE